MKPNCVVCGEPIYKQSPKRWEEVGNYCEPCLSKANRGVEALRAKNAFWIDFHRINRDVDNKVDKRGKVVK